MTLKIAMGVCLGALAVLPAQPQWQYVKKADPLHGKVIDGFVLDGVYLTPPSISTTTPSIVVRCSAGKVESSYFAVGAVVDITRALEARFDGKSHTIYAADKSTDGTSIYLIEADLKGILEAHQVIVGANEYLGPQVVMQFEVPDPSQVMEKCGAGRVLRGRGGLHRK